MKVSIAAMVAAVWLVAGSAAEAVPISYETTGFGAVTFFPGTPQETQIDFGGCPGASPLYCQTSLDLTSGVPLFAISHIAEFDVGTNVPSFPDPDDTKTIETIFTVGSRSATLTQDVRFQQIGNGQFQVTISGSSTATLDLGALGLLDITAQSLSTQLPSDMSGGQALLRSAFLLRAPVAAVPEPATAALLGVGLAGLGMLRRRRRRRC